MHEHKVAVEHRPRTTVDLLTRIPPPLHGRDCHCWLSERRRCTTTIEPEIRGTVSNKYIQRYYHIDIINQRVFQIITFGVVDFDQKDVVRIKVSCYYLRRRRRLCFWCGLFVCLSVCLFVCLSVGLLANL